MIRTYQKNRSRHYHLPLELRALMVDHLREPVTRLSGIDLHQWVLCTGGEGELFVRNRRYMLKKGIGFFLPAGEPHTYHGKTDDFTVDAFAFSGEAALSILKILGCLEPGVFRFSRPDLFQEHIRVLDAIMTDSQPLPKERSSGEVYKFLVGIQHSIRQVADPLTQPKKSGPRFIPELIVYMEEHLEEPLSLDDMAERFHRTKEHICHAFKEETGITYVDFLTRVRLFKARDLLLDHPEMKLAEVARQCGFSSASYFGSLFKRDVGMTPGMFRLAERRS